MNTENLFFFLRCLGPFFVYLHPNQKEREPRDGDVIYDLMFIIRGKARAKENTYGWVSV